MKIIDITIDNHILQIKAQEIKDQIWFHYNGKTFVIDKKKESSSVDDSISKNKADSNIIFAHIPGQIIKILVKKGDVVQQNQTILIVSSMKMEHTIKAHCKGVVENVYVKEGEKISIEQILMKLKYS